MKDTFTKSMRWLHTWASLVLGWLLFFIFLTGTLGYFEKEITRWMQPELPMATSKFSNQELAHIALNHLKQEAPNSKKWVINLPNSREEVLSVKWNHVTDKKETAMGGHGRGRAKSTTQILDPHSKEVVTPRDTGGGGVLYRMHYTLHYVDARTTGRYIVGIASMLMLIGLLTGVIIHLRGIFKDFFTFRQDKNLRSWLDAHIVTGVIALPFHIMITYSGLAFFIFMYMPFTALVNYDGKMMDYRKAAFPSEHPIEIKESKVALASIDKIISKSEAYFEGAIKSITIVNQGNASAVVRIKRENTTLLSGDKVDKLYFSGSSGEIIKSLSPEKPEASNARSILTGLHRGLFADIYIRWLYFLSGILGTVMIASGLVIWTKKREAKQQDTLGFKVVDNLNMSTIAGLPLAIAAYFWANRLLPVDMINRETMETDAMFFTWVLVLLFTIVMSSRKVWVILFYLSAFLYTLLPIFNFFFTERHLGITLAHGDWTLVWMDLMLVFTGFVFWFTGYKVQKKLGFSFWTKTYSVPKKIAT